MTQALGAILGGGLALGGSLISSNASNAASGKMSQADLFSAMLAQQRFQQVAGSVQPYINSGTSASNALAPLIGTNPGGNPLTAALTARFQPTMAQLEQTPGYQFTLGQGQNALTNQFAARGLGGSGNLFRGLQDYTTGLASNTFQQQFQNYLTQNSQIYNMLSGQAGLGLSAAPFANLLSGLGGVGLYGGNNSNPFASFSNSGGNFFGGLSNALSGIGNNVSGALQQTGIY
jgi:hypothetical protein